METEANFSAITPPVFEGDNYQVWAIRMEAYLEALDIWEVVEEDYEIPPLRVDPTMAQIKAHKEKKTKKSKAKACLFATVSSTILTRIMTLKSAYEIWNYLKTKYEGNERIKGMRVLNLIREFELQEMKEIELIKEYSDRLLDIANRIRLLGSAFKDSRIVEKILVTVPEKYEASISTLENTKDLIAITLAEIINALQAQEQRRVMRHDTIVEGALPAKHNDARNNSKKKFVKKTPNYHGETSNKVGFQKKSYPPCHHCNRKGHPPFKCWRRPDAKCTKCNQMGHETIICKSKHQQQSDEANIAEKEKDKLFVVTCFVGSESNESWLIDSGYTNHMTHDKELFKDLKPTNITKVKIGNGDSISVKGKGTIAIESSQGTKHIYDVLFVPDIDQNLLSVGQLIENGYKVIFEDECCLIKDGANQDIFKVKMKGKSFSLSPLEKEQSVFSLKEDVTQIWHKRVGHYHHEGLLQLREKEMALDVPKLDNAISSCQACQFGKQNRKPFPMSTRKATHKLQLIHTDVAGPQRTPSLKGNLYYIIFIDDFTRMCWIFFLKFKSEVAQVFWKFKAKVENESGCKIQTIRSDNGKEYTSAEFERLCENSGIEHQLTAPYTPQ